MVVRRPMETVAVHLTRLVTAGFWTQGREGKGIQEMVKWERSRREIRSMGKGWDRKGLGVYEFGRGAACCETERDDLCPKPLLQRHMIDPGLVARYPKGRRVRDRFCHARVRESASAPRFGSPRRRIVSCVECWCH